MLHAREKLFLDFDKAFDVIDLKRDNNVLFLDFSKAFDSVDRVIEKLLDTVAPCTKSSWYHRMPRDITLSLDEDITPSE